MDGRTSEKNWRTRSCWHIRCKWRTYCKTKKKSYAKIRTTRRPMGKDIPRFGGPIYFRERKGTRDVAQKIIVLLFMQCFGLPVVVPPGVTYHNAMGTGTQYSNASTVGPRKAFGSPKRWHQVFEQLQEPDLDWLLIDSTTIRAHQHAAGQKKAKTGWWGFGT